jgi:4-amino-4-deoxy-L-arabinose transferase-like glycosyltransferase
MVVMRQEERRRRPTERTFVTSSASLPSVCAEGAGPPGPEEGGAGRLSSYVWVLLVLVLAVVLRILYALPRHACAVDESFYLWLARNLFSGEGFTYYCGEPELHFTPLFPIVLGMLQWIVGDWEAVSRVAYVIFGGLLPLPVYLLAREMHGRRVALTASVLAAILPAFTSGVLFAETLSEPLYLFFLFWGLHQAFLASRDLTLKASILAGAFFSLAYLTRPEGEVFFFVSLGCLCAVLAWRRSLPLGTSLLRPVALILSFLIIASPYLVYLRTHLGFWTLTTKSTTSYITTRPLVDNDRAGFHKLNSGLNANGEMVMYAHDFGRGLLDLLLGLYRHRVIPDIRKNAQTALNYLLTPRVYGRALLALALLGLLGASWSRRRFSTELFNCVLVLPVLPVLIFFIKERFLYPWLLPLLIWSALGVHHLLAWVDGTEFPGFLGRCGVRVALKTVFVLALGAYLLSSAYRHFALENYARAPIWDNVAWLEAHTPEDAVILTAGPEIAFHANRRWLPLPVASLQDIIKFGRERGATHLSLLRCYVESRPDQKRELFDGARDFEDLELLVKPAGKVTDASFVVYRFKSRR